MERPRSGESATSLGHETRDANARKVALFGLAVAVVTVLVLVVMWGLFGFFIRLEASRDRPAPPLAAEREPPMGPRLQVAPARDLEEMHASEDEYLNSYGWINTERGIVHVPIERAMDLLLEQGLPVRESGESGAAQEVHQ